MTDKADKLISDFNVTGWKTPDIHKRLFELTTNSEEIYSFSKQFINANEKGATIFNDSLSYIDREQFAELIVLALNILKIKRNENAEEVIHYAALQFPHLLHEHLELIFELKCNERNYYAAYPWRYLPSDKITFFKDQFVDLNTRVSDKQTLFKCLLETRNLDIIKFAVQYATDVRLFDREDLEDYLVHHLELVGFTKINGNIEKYCLDVVKHFSFSGNYFSKNFPIQINKKQHPTWNLVPNGNYYKFGGLLQENGNNPFLHIITFDKIPEDIGVTGLSKLILGMHICELNDGYGSIFYQHDADGTVRRIGELNEIEIDELPIKETRISFSETPERWKDQCYGSSNGRENLFRLGGEPTWIQNAEVLTCPICHEKMDFLLQLDTDLPNTEKGEVFFGSGGICYVFWCNKTKVSGYVMQCT